jgi:hypothetical protein
MHRRAGLVEGNGRLILANVFPKETSTVRGFGSLLGEVHRLGKAAPNERRNDLGDRPPNSSDVASTREGDI